MPAQWPELNMWPVFHTCAVCLPVSWAKLCFTHFYIVSLPVSFSVRSWVVFHTFFIVSPCSLPVSITKVSWTVLHPFLYCLPACQCNWGELSCVSHISQLSPCLSVPAQWAKLCFPHFSIVSLPNYCTLHIYFYPCVRRTPLLWGQIPSKKCVLYQGKYGNSISRFFFHF